MEANKPKLLLADDSATIRKVVELTFADEGVEVTSAIDAPSTMQKFVDVQPDIVLIDVGLPGGTNGYQICEMIKTDKTTNHIPVLLLVGSFEPFDQVEADRVGADGFLTKPFQSIRTVVDRVFGLLNNQEVGRGEGESETVSTIESAAEDESPTTDIDSLYQSSVLESVHVGDFRKTEDAFSDAHLDDELIETSYPASEDSGDLSQFASETATDLEMSAYDWSTDSGERASDAASDKTEHETRSAFVEPVLSGSVSPKDRVARQPSLAPLEDLLDISIPVFSAPGNTKEPSPISTDTRAQFTQTQPNTEVSQETIAIIVDRVVERLSDRAVREIAQEAVPRIAEKLIREALEDEKNR